MCKHQFWFFYKNFENITNFFVKYDANGNLVWVNLYPTSGLDVTGAALTTGEFNVIIGREAGLSTTDVDYTVIIGKGAAAANLTNAADGTICIGASAGAAITSGAGNLAIGYLAATSMDEG